MDLFLSNDSEKNIQNILKTPDRKRLPCRYCKKVPLWSKIRRQETAPYQRNKSARKKKNKKNKNKNKKKQITNGEIAPYTKPTTANRNL